MSTPIERQFVLTAPMVLRRAKASSSKKNAKKVKKEAERLERHATKAVLTMTKALEKGVKGYRKSRKKSRKNKRGIDDALSAVPAVLEGTAIAVRRMSLVPVGLTRVATSKKTRILFRLN